MASYQISVALVWCFDFSAVFQGTLYYVTPGVQFVHRSYFTLDRKTFLALTPILT
jgi:hypothetical protein